MKKRLSALMCTMALLAQAVISPVSGAAESAVCEPENGYAACSADDTEMTTSDETVSEETAASADAYDESEEMYTEESCCEVYDEDEMYCSPVDPLHIAADDDGVSMYADNEVLVVAAEGTCEEQIRELAEQYGAEITGCIKRTVDYQLKLHSGNARDAVRELEKSELISFAGLNYITEAEGCEAAERTEDSFGGAWGCERINAPEAQRLMAENGPSPVRVGVIDIGFNEKHEDVRFAENGVFYQNGRNGTELFSEWEGETVTVDGESIDKEYYYTHHGTHVAGIMAACGQESDSLTGVYPYGSERMYGVSFSGVSGDFSETSLPENAAQNVSAMQYKLALSELLIRNVKVINASVGWGTIDSYNEDGSLKETDTSREECTRQLEDFLKRMIENGYDFVIVCSAGNDSDSDEELSAKVPTGHLESRSNSVFSAITDPEIKDRIIVVGSVDKNNEISDFSDAGERVDIFAPGRDILSAWSACESDGGKSEKYHLNSGTSMAAPHVSGTAADVWSMNNKLTGIQVKKIVCGSWLKDEDDIYLRPYVTPDNRVMHICDCEEAVRMAIQSRYANIIIAGELVSSVIDIRENMRTAIVCTDVNVSEMLICADKASVLLAAAALDSVACGSPQQNGLNDLISLMSVVVSSLAVIIHVSKVRLKKLRCEYLPRY